MRKIASLIVMLMLFQVLAFTQTRTITGVVKDEAGLIVPGASIKIKGTNTGTAADNQGQFRIQAKAGDVLLVTGAGIDPAEITVGAADAVAITVKNTIATGSEVVVTALGIKRQDKALGYGVSKVDPNSLLQKSEPNVLAGLAGKVPGVDIRGGQGAPGAAARIQIRGVSSFTGGEPLIVVDGIPYSNNLVNTTNPFTAGGTYGSGFADLDPNDIETINILKGAAAAALYGSRAANGVLLITTKSAAPKKGQKSLNVTYKTGYSQEKISGIPEFQNLYGAGANFRVQASNGSWGGKFGKGVIYNSTGDVIGTSASGIDSIPATTWATMFNSYPELFPNGRLAYKAVPNNVSSLFNTGTLWENSVGLNGGEGNSLFNLTLSRVDQKGYITNSSYVKNNVSAGGQTSIGKLTVGASVAYTRSKQIGGFIGGPQSFLSQWGRTFTMARNWDIAGWPSQDKAGNQIGFNDNQYTNPVWGAYHNTITSIDDRVVASARANYKFNSTFSINYNAGINSYALFRDQIIDKSSYGSSDNLLGTLTEVINRTQEIQSTLVLVYTPKIGSNFTLDVKLGNDINQRTGRNQQVQGVNFVIPGLYNLTNTSTQRFQADAVTKRRIVGFFGDVSLGYRNFAFLNITGREDLTSTLPYENAQYFYPGISGSLIWTDAFKLRSSWLDYGKIRAGYAKVGNDAAPHQEPIFNLNAAGFLGQPLLSRGGSSYDPELTPEFTREIEVGTEMRFFKRRIGFELTYYNKKSTDLIYAISLPSTTGYTSFFTNLGQIRNKGWEAALDARPLSGRDFTWDIRAIFTKNENTVEELVAGLTRDQNGNNWIEPGYPYGYIRGSHSARDENGRLLINPANGAPFVDPNDDMIGDPNPEFKLGITNTLSYKGFQLSFLFDWTQGGDLLSETIISMLGRGVTLDTKDREKSAVIDGVYGNPTPVPGADGKNHYVPLLVGGKPVENQTRITTNDLFFSPTGTGATFATNGAAEYSVFDATVYRLREMVLAYNLPSTLVNKLKLTNVTFSISGRNLWFLAPNTPKYMHIDPDFNSVIGANQQGVDGGGAPSTRRIGVNLNITF